MRDAYVVRVNVHRQLWDGTVCTNPLGWADCLAREDFKASYCAKGNPKCYFVNLFHRNVPQVRLPKEQEAYREVFDQQAPAPGDLFVFWGSYGDRVANFVIGLWEVSSFDESDGKDFVVKGEPDGAVRLGSRIVGCEVLNSRVSRAVGGDAIRLLPAARLPIVVSQLHDAAEADFQRLFKAGLNTDTARPVVEALALLAGRLPDVPEGHLTQRIVIPVALLNPPPPARPVQSPPAGPGPRRPAPPAIDFPAQLVDDYALALRVSPLVLLAGPSGSGKTRLTRDFAASVGAAYRLVAVRPDWRSNEDLLGYLPPFGGSFVPSEFSLHVREAANEHAAAAKSRRPPRPYHLCLDEMNLARPEHYLAEVLSKMELEAPLRRLRLYESTEDQGFPREIWLAPNLSIVGTVNNDDTTFPFSPKVIDRAVYLTCDQIDLARFFAGRPGPVSDFVGPVLAELDGILRQVGLRLGYRVAGQVLAWVSHALESGPIPPAPGPRSIGSLPQVPDPQGGSQAKRQLAALDGAVRHLVLPRLRLARSEPAHREALAQLRTYLAGLGGAGEDAMQRSVSFAERLESALGRREVAFGQLET